MAVSHIDRTVVPAKYTAALERFPAAINLRCTDITKTRYSRIRVTRDDPYPGPVIVKTVRNFGGRPEFLATQRHRAGIVREPTDWRIRTSLDPAAYPIFEHSALVPEGVWENPHLFVEKFLPERDAAGNYRVRKWYFLADRAVGVCQTTRQPIAKKAELGSELFTEAPPELDELRRYLKADFGRIDYGMVNGRPVIYDLNTTPTLGQTGLPLLRPYLPMLASGLRSFLDPEVVRSLAVPPAG